jgi:hypothetical protein
VNRFNAHCLYIPVGDVFIRVHHIKALSHHAPCKPTEPQLIEPASANGKFGYGDVCEKLGRLVKALRDHRDLTLVKHGRCQRYGQVFSASPNFRKIASHNGKL